jgi:hypothetical protein
MLRLAGALAGAALLFASGVAMLATNSLAFSPLWPPPPSSLGSCATHFCGVGDITTFAPWYSASFSYSYAYAQPGTNNMLLLDRFNSGGTYQDSCTVKVYTDGTPDLTHTAGCPGSTTVDVWGQNRSPLGTEFIKINTFYDMTGSSYGDAVAVATTNAGEVRFAWGSDGLCYTPSIPCAVSPTIATQEYRSANNYTPASPLAISDVGGKAVNGVFRFVQCGGWSASSDINNAISSSGSSANWTIDGQGTTGASDGAIHAANGSMDDSGPTATLNIDGTENGGTKSINTTVAKVRIFGRAGQTLNTQFNEGGCSVNMNTAGLRAAVRANQQTRYGTP